MAEYDKQCLPNYQVFDEKRYFTAGSEACVVSIHGISVALTICEDIWHDEPVAQAKAAGASVLININASPFHRGKQLERLARVSSCADAHQLPILYVNQVGGQDELVFDGGSFAVDAQGALCVSLSGGIDSAVTLAVAVDALGPERVEAVMMPFHYTASMSIEDAEAEAAALGVRFSNLSIAPLYESFMSVLADEFEGLAPNITEENLQARCRGVLLMSISNKKNLLVLTTGNKSELAVGYSTLYGDMAGGFDVLKDCRQVLSWRPIKRTRTACHLMRCWIRSSSST